MIDFIGLNDKLIRLQDQVIKLGNHVLELRKKVDLLETWAESRGS